MSKNSGKLPHYAEVNLAQKLADNGSGVYGRLCRWAEETDMHVSLSGKALANEAKYLRREQEQR